MTTPSSPHYRTGKICYLEIPANDVAASAQFYQQVFGWLIRQRADDSIAFDDTVGEVSGTWVLGCPPSSEPGLVVFILVASAATTIEAIITAGSTIVSPSTLMSKRSMPYFVTLRATYSASINKRAC
jgi:predicted enzyme related to lactoylglutathione lyase